MVEWTSDTGCGSVAESCISQNLCLFAPRIGSLLPSALAAIASQKGGLQEPIQTSQSANQWAPTQRSCNFSQPILNPLL